MKYLLAGAVAIILFIVVVAACSAPTPVPGYSSTIGQTSVPAVTPAVGVGDGTYDVPRDMAPGQYAALPTTSFCAWSVVPMVDRGDVGYGDGPQLVTLAAGDQFQTRGCGGWTTR